jgi:surface antigen
MRETLPQKSLTFDMPSSAPGESWLTRFHQWQGKGIMLWKSLFGYRIIRVFRGYSAFSIVAGSALLVSATNVAQGKGFNEVLSGYMGGEEAAENPAAKRLAVEAAQKDNLSLVALASQEGQAQIDTAAQDDTSLFDVEGGVMPDQVVASVESNIQKDPEEEGGLTLYTVNDGDTLGSVAKQFNITVNTILWANDIKDEDEIKPGDQIFILPVAGLTHVVKSGDTIDTVASAYQANKDEIIAFNNLPANGQLTDGDSLVIPGGQKKNTETESEKNPVERRQYANTSGGETQNISSGGSEAPAVSPSKGGAGHRFPYGYCTWYVAQKRHVPWGGNAGAWLANSKAYGYKTGKTPAVGAVVVTTENRYYGHVAYVEKVSGSTITISEMNYTGWGKTSRRTLDKNSRVIRGYVY